MATIRNVAVTGAAGALGKPILDAIVSSGKFNVTVLVRSTSKADFPSSVAVKVVDFASVESLTSALQGQDAVVSAVGSEGLLGQDKVIDAAIAAGVKRFLPSEYGSNLDIPKTKALPVFGYKVATTNYVEEKARQNPGFTYTLVRNGAFLDWGLDMAFLFDWKTDSPAIYNSGDELFSTTTLKSVGVAVVGVLLHPEETKNKRIYVEDMQLTQNRILAIAKEIAPQRKWSPVHVNTEEMKSKLDEKLAKGDITPGDMYGYLFSAIFGDGYGGLMEKNDNNLLGVEGNLTDEDVKALLKPLLAK